MRNVLVIAYYFPPMGLSGIQRTLKFVKYLPEYGWRPTVLTISPHAYFAFDDTFLEELRGRDIEIWRTRPGGLFSFMGKRKTVSLSNEGARRLLNRVSQALFIPDNKIGWRKHALRFLEEKDMSRFHAVYATAPPFTDHILGADVKERYGLPLVVDFRDAWLEYPYHRYLTSRHRKRHEELERRVVTTADAAVTTNGFVRETLAKRYPGAAGRIRVITQGYDADDFGGTPRDEERPDPEEVNFIYSGVFYEDRDPIMLYRALQRIRETNPAIYSRLRFYMVGYVQEEYRNAAEKMGVGERFVYCGYVDHDQAIRRLESVDVAWFNIGARDQGFQTVSPGKAFEYLGSGKPILGILPQNEIRTILASFGHTRLVDPEDDDALVRELLRFAEEKIKGTLPKGDMNAIARYDRRVLTGDLAELLGSVAREVS